MKLSRELKLVGTAQGQRLTKLEVVRGDRSASLLDPSAAVAFSTDNMFRPERRTTSGTVGWIGPQTMADILGYLHELGHRGQARDHPAGLKRLQMTRVFVQIPQRPSEATAKAALEWLGNERDAWARALGIRRNLARQGLDPLPGVPLAQIRLVVDHALATYVGKLRNYFPDGALPASSPGTPGSS